MNNAIKLFKVRGIDIKMHITFPLILVWGALSFGLFRNGGWEGAIYGILVTSLVFVIVVLHELGHSAAALHYNVPVKEIVLLPIGGVAQLEEIPEEPRKEFVIAAAGPLVNLVLAILMVLISPLMGQNFSASSLLKFTTSLGVLSFSSIFTYIFTTNLFIGLFNLIPAYPMDGGRILRALLASRLSYVKATSVAVFIGQLLSWGFGLVGFLTGNYFLIILAFFIYNGAGQEGRLIQFRNVLGDLRVEQAYSRGVRSINLNEPIETALHFTLNSFQSSFPICDEGKLAGVLPYQGLVEALEKKDLQTPIREVMQTGIKPVSPRDKLIDVQMRMSSQQINALPVVDNENFVGMITSQDLNEAYRISLALDKAKPFLRLQEAARI
ncbi:MAG: site-2 protease family protein [Anaerolineales bacterium]